jgi:hypothetical protein
VGGLSAAAIEQIIQRVFIERRETLDAAAQAYDIDDFRATIVRLRESMAVTIAALPDSVFWVQGETSTSISCRPTLCSTQWAHSVDLRQASRR